MNLTNISIGTVAALGAYTAYRSLSPENQIRSRKALAYGSMIGFPLYKVYTGEYSLQGAAVSVALNVGFGLGLKALSGVIQNRVSVSNLLGIIQYGFSDATRSMREKVAGVALLGLGVFYLYSWHKNTQEMAVAQLEWGKNMIKLMNEFNDGRMCQNFFNSQTLNTEPQCSIHCDPN